MSPADAQDATAARTGVVVIGRNEGERLRRCLVSVAGAAQALVYVDSGSTDGSPELARSLGAEVVALDMSRPFTAGRARNAGWRQLLAQHPAIDQVQFVDGDCELLPGWLAAAGRALAQRPDLAVCFGRLHERHPEASVFNRLCDLEWNVPVGEARACGGNALFRAAVLQSLGGFRDDMIAGEEPELCVRLRAAGWKILRIDHDMAWHDSAMYHWRQWWRRSKRAGHAFAQGASLHGQPPERLWVRETRRALLWGLALPLVIGALALVLPACAALAAVYPLQILRLAARPTPAARAAHAAWLQATFLVLGRFPEAQGVLLFHRQRRAGRAAPLIEYK